MIIYVTINFSRRVFSMELLTVYQHAPKLQWTSLLESSFISTHRLLRSLKNLWKVA
jgi:hypothetical protein